jgi:hypothetical protein
MRLCCSSVINYAAANNSPAEMSRKLIFRKGNKLSQACTVLLPVIAMSIIHEE